MRVLGCTVIRSDPAKVIVRRGHFAPSLNQGMLLPPKRNLPIWQKRGGAVSGKKLKPEHTQAELAKFKTSPSSGFFVFSADSRKINLMKSDDLRHIGKAVFEAIKDSRPKGQAPLERGAGGDRTFPIDRLAEDIIIDGLRKLGEPLHIVSEEAGLVELEGAGEALTVAIDPIDGSKNAITGLPFWGASIAVSRNGEIGGLELGYVINLVTGDEFWAERGRGAFQNGPPVRCQKDSVIALCAFEARIPSIHYKEILPVLESARRTRCFGSIALDLAYLASGAVSVFVSPGASRSFDYAAGYLMVKEAGGVFTDMEGGELNTEKIGLHHGGASLLASANPEIHKKVLEILHDRKYR